MVPRNRTYILRKDIPYVSRPQLLSYAYLISLLAMLGGWHWSGVRFVLADDQRFKIMHPHPRSSSNPIVFVPSILPQVNGLYKAKMGLDSPETKPAYSYKYVGGGGNTKLHFFLRVFHVLLSFPIRRRMKNEHKKRTRVQSISFFFNVQIRRL